MAHQLDCLSTGTGAAVALASGLAQVAMITVKPAEQTASSMPNDHKAQ